VHLYESSDATISYHFRAATNRKAALKPIVPWDEHVNRVAAYPGVDDEVRVT
jgi:hypothetical protein